MNVLRVLLVSSATAFVLGACTTIQPTHYYSLLPATRSVDERAEKPVSRPAFAISVQGVQLPEQVDRPQIVITDPASTQVTPLNSSLWAAPLADEIRNALSEDLSRRLGVLDISLTGAPSSLPIWRVALNVQRFESVYGQRAVLDATWRLTPVNQRQKKPIICRAEVQLPVEVGMSAMVEGHQKALRLLADVIADQLPDGGKPTPAPEVILKGCT